jgi:poly-beta-1,6-N-acetyl-D-glucosamine synthase
LNYFTYLPMIVTVSKRTAIKRYHSNRKIKGDTILASETIHNIGFLSNDYQDIQQITYSVGVMAYNEEANIGRTLQAILTQNQEKTHLAEVIVVASGCTDNTVGETKKIMETDKRVSLIVQEQREGKASAINLFLQQARSAVLVLVGADVIPERDTLELLCSHFATPSVGMVGAHPIPVNDQDTFVGHAVHLLWFLHDRVARRHPKLGEVIAFRNIVHSIPADTAVDEISLQAAIASHHLDLVYDPEAIVYNKGPMTIRDFLKQRRRIHAGHLQVKAQGHYEASTMKVGPIVREIVACASYTIKSPKQFVWTLGTIALEGLARFQGQYDATSNHSHHIWQAVASTKALEDEQRKLRRISRGQSVISFQVKNAGLSSINAHDPSEASKVRRMLHSLLPSLRKYVRKDDLLSLQGTNMLVAVLDAEDHGAEYVAQRLQAGIEALAKEQKHQASLQTTYHVVSFNC